MDAHKQKSDQHFDVVRRETANTVSFDVYVSVEPVEIITLQLTPQDMLDALEAIQHRLYNEVYLWKHRHEARDKIDQAMTAFIRNSPGQPLDPPGSD